MEDNGQETFEVGGKEIPAMGSPEKPIVRLASMMKINWPMTIPRNEIIQGDRKKHRQRSVCMQECKLIIIKKGTHVRKRTVWAQ